MNVNISSFHSLQRINQQHIVLNAMMNQKKSINKNIDMFIRSCNNVNDAGLYSDFTFKKNKYISDTLLLLINNDISKVRKHGEEYECAGVRFTADQIPKIDTSTLSEVKAYNNTIDFGQNTYFKYVSSDGNEHALFTDDNGVGAIYSERMRGAEYDAIGDRYVYFWRYMMSDDPVYIGLTYSKNEIREFMSEAGMEVGFFTVKMGNRESTQYYTGSETAGVIHSKHRYDSKYEHLTSTGYQLMNYEPGSIFKIGDNEYILSENHTLDIPYGEDIYSLKYPSNYRFGNKID